MHIKILLFIALLLVHLAEAQSVFITEPRTNRQVEYRKIAALPKGFAVDNVIFLKKKSGLYQRVAADAVTTSWYGTETDQAALEKSIKAASLYRIPLVLEPRTYLLSRPVIFHGLSDITVRGVKGMTKIAPADRTRRLQGYYFRFDKCENIAFENVTFDHNKSNLPTYTRQDYTGVEDDLLRDFNSGLYFFLSKNITVSGCSFEDLYTKSVTFYQCSGKIKVITNTFSSGYQQQKYRMEFLNLWQSHSADIEVKDNLFTSLPNSSECAPAAIFGFSLGNGGKVTVENNTFHYLGRDNTGTHRLYAVDFYDDVNNFVIRNNTFSNCTWGAIRFDGSKGNANISANRIEQLISNDSGIIDASLRISTGNASGYTISDNIIISKSDQSYGIQIQNLFNENTLKNVAITGNTFQNIKGATHIIGNISEMKILNNIAEVSGFFLNVSFEFLNQDIGKNTKIGGFEIAENIIKCKKNALCTGVQINEFPQLIAKRAPYNIRNNKIDGNGGNFGIVVNGNGKNMNRNVIIDNNEIQNFSTGLYLRNKNTKVYKNTLKNVSRAYLEEDVNDKQLNRVTN